jgi:HEAT repeat protein
MKDGYQVMAEEQKTVTPATTPGGGMSRSSNRSVPSSRVLRNMLVGVGIALVLIVLEIVLWIVNPLHVVSRGTPLLLLIPLFTLLVVCALVQFTARPLALLAYLRDVQRSQEGYATTYVPLSADPNSDDLEQNVSLLELVQQQDANQLILGASGAGKTMLLCAYLYRLARQGRALVRKRQRIPVFVSLNQYSLFLAQRQMTSDDTAGRVSLLDYLYASDALGMRHVRPYLRTLLGRGRLLLLCDGLNEVEAGQLDVVSAELAGLMRQGRNRLLVTCREADYRRFPQLAQLIGDTGTEQVVIYPLGEQQKRLFVERSIKGQEPDRPRQQRQPRQQHTAGQIMELIRRTRLRYHCSNPMMLAMLMGMIDGIGLERARRMDTRGRLIREYVAQRIRHEQRQPRWSKTAPTSNEVLMFLCEIACAARWSHARYAIQLPGSPPGKGESTLTPARIQSLAGELQRWLDEHPAMTAYVPGGNAATSALHEPYTREKLAQLLEFAQGTSLLTITPGGVVSFSQELIAEYLVAQYFIMTESTLPAPLPLRQELFDDVAYWCEPTILWAGLLEQPLELAQRFADPVQIPPGRRLEALALGLFCIGVMEAPPQAAVPDPVGLPSHVEAALVAALRDAAAREKLASIFTRCAEEGGQEVYRSLLLLLLVDGIDKFLVLLDTAVITELLFNYLVESADDVARDTQVKRLIRILGRFGEAAVPRASELSQVGPQRSRRLRSVAINILGVTNSSRAVEPLIACLADTNPFIVERAVSALVRLGPERTLPQLFQVLANRKLTPTVEQMHLAVLKILERYLDEPAATHQLTAQQHQQIVEALMPVMTSTYAAAAQQKAREILARQGHTAGERESGEKTLQLLIHNLASTDEAMASNAIHALKAVGPVATPTLGLQLQQQASELARARIVEVFAEVRDQRALPDLLRLMADPAPIVQQQVAKALRQYVPTCIPGLIELVLHSVNEAVATRAEEVLISIGGEVVEQVVQALHPLVPGRTLLLVHVLEEVHDIQSLPALIDLLESAQADPALALAVVRTLGQFPDQRVVSPLLAALASSHVLLYEGAINALSQLGDVAVEQLIVALDVQQTTPMVARVERALLGMLHFPGQQLLDALADGSEAQAGHIMEIFLAKGADAAHLLVPHLFDGNARLQRYVRQTVNRMEGQVVVPALLEVLHHPEAAWRELIAAYLLKHPQEAIPPLVSLLGEYERAEAAEAVLIQFGPAVLPLIVPGLDAQSSIAQKRAQHVIVALARQRPEMLPHVMQLFTLSLPGRAREALLDILTDDLVDISVPALLEGLEDAYLVGDASEALVRLIRKRDARGEQVMEGLLGALRVDERRHGASIALVELGELAVHPVGNLITDSDREVALAAQDILCEIGVPAFSFIWAAHSDTSNRARRDAARNVFRNMPTAVIKDELVNLLTSNEPDNISMALSLLLERIHDETLQAHSEHEMVPALLEHVQTHSGERASQRIIALLLLLGGNTIVDHMTQALFDEPEHQERLLYAFLLLGSEAENILLDVCQDPNTPPALRAEVAGILGMLTEQGEVAEYARTLGESGLWAARTINRTGILQPERLAVSLRALGGLLASGRWDIPRLQGMRTASKEGSAARELYEVLLGWRNSPRIAVLENDLLREREEHERNLRELTKELLMKQMHIKSLEHDLEQVRSEHDARVEELQRAAQEKQSLRENLQRVVQERQVLNTDLQQLMQERERLRAQNEQWRAYSERLEEQLRDLAGEGKQ